MKKLMVLALALLPACSLKTRTIPDAPLPFASVDYTVLGSTTADSCGTYILAIDFGHLFSTTKGGTSTSGSGSSSSPISAILGAVMGGMGPEESRALYDALEKMPEATNLYAPRIETEASGVGIIMGRPIFGQRCATVEAHGVKLGSGPVPGAH
jgi:hypothetical protein